MVSEFDEEVSSERFVFLREDAIDSREPLDYFISAGCERFNLFNGSTTLQGCSLVDLVEEFSNSGLGFKHVSCRHFGLLWIEGVTRPDSDSIQSNDEFEDFAFNLIIELEIFPSQSSC